MNVPLAVLLLLSFFNEIPRDLDDAAMVDGATRFGAFRNSLTLVRAGLVATAVLAFIFSWNEFLLSLVLTTGGVRTVPVASSTFTTAFQTEWGYLAALGITSMVPIFVFILIVQRHLGPRFDPRGGQIAMDPACTPPARLASASAVESCSPTSDSLGRSARRYVPRSAGRRESSRVMM